MELCLGEVEGMGIMMESRIINDRKYFVYCKEDNVPLDSIAIKMMEQNSIEGLLPFRHIQQGKEKYFRYGGWDGETLEGWLQRVQYRQDVTKLLESLIFISREIGAYLLEPDHLCTDVSFIAVKDNQCEAAYIPVGEGTQGNILQLAQKVAASVKYAFDEDFSYLFDLQNAFGRGDIQNMADLKKWLRIVNGEEEPARVLEPSLGVDSVSSVLMAEAAVEVNLSSAVDMDSAGDAPIPKDKGKTDSLEGVFGDIGLGNKKKEKSVKKAAEKQGFFSKNKKRNQHGNSSSEEKETGRPIAQGQSVPKKREIINDLDRGDDTVLVAEDTVPRLVRVKNGVEYSLAEGSCVIGSGVQADIVVPDNLAVSRKHARIFVNDASYYIEDLGSTNGTCVNGEILREMEPYKLGDRARIQLSDEDYIFVKGLKR